MKLLGEILRQVVVPIGSCHCGRGYKAAAKGKWLGHMFPSVPAILAGASCPPGQIPLHRIHSHWSLPIGRCYIDLIGWAVESAKFPLVPAF